MAVENDCRSIAYTYTEPTIYFEYALDTAVLARESGLKNVFVTNGYTSEEAIRAAAPYLDGANVDLKSFREDFYKNICGAELEPVLHALRLYRELEDTRVHVVVQGDTLFDLAGRYFSPLPRACGYWWAIADFQPDVIVDPTLELELGRRMHIPSLRVLTDVILAGPRRSVA